MTGWREWTRRLTGRVRAGLLALVLVVVLAGTAGAASYMQPYLDKVVEWGVMRGDIAGNLNENNPITRAEFCTMINRAFGYSRMGSTPFRDVKNNAWYAQDVAIAYTTGYIKGTSASTFSPESNITREQAAVILSRILMLPEEVGENTVFSDSRSMANWSQGYIAAAAHYGLVNGYPDGRFGPQDNLTRGQAAILLVNALGTPIREAGTYTLGSVWGSVTITTSGVTLRDTVVGGNLYITAGVDLGYATLENVTVLGDIVISGGGTSEGGEDSVILRNVTAPRMLVDNLGNRFTSVKVEGDGLINQASVRTNAYLEDNTPDGCGVARIDLDGEEELTLTLAGNIKEVVNSAPRTTLELASGQAKTITVDEAAVDSTLSIAAGAQVEQVNLDTGIEVTGDGDIANLTVNAAGSTVSMLPDQIIIRPGITANIDGEVMDSAAAAESSADPRLYAGYPQVRDLAPTSATVAFSANKRGTIYWAVTAVTDGSLTAEEIINPSTYSPKIVKSGTVSLSGSGKEGTAKISGLTSDGAYYLSTVFVDARDERSPLKVISFTTPDNTKPAFASGYPYMSKVTNIYGQTTVMTTKTCRLYYAVLEKGASAPTASDFKANAVTGNLGFGSMDVVKNTPYSFRVNSVPLDELESYDLYLWLTDVDGAQSSAVKKLTFTTVDGTPPRFRTEPTVNNVKETSVGLYANLNEAGTLYWVIVEEGTTYPKPLAGQSGEVDLSSDAAKLQVMAGMNALKSGKVSMSADKDVSFNISGLQEETAYDLYYVAQDKAGNYSDTVGKLTIHTLDNTVPTVTQEFTKYNGTASDTPLPESDVRLVFSEGIQTVGNYTKLTDLYQKVIDAQTESAKAEARTELANALSNAIYFYQVPAGSQPVKVEGADDADKKDDSWVIDYRYAEVTMEEGKTVITFPNGSGINLKSGATYYFEIQANTLADTSSAANVMGRTQLPRFTTVFAVVNLSALNENSIQVGGSAVTTDLSWRLTPVSTDKVDDSIDWDMLIWSDTSVEFNLYAREVGAGSDGAWKLLGKSKIDVPDTAQGYLGISLTRNFLEAGTNNPDFEALNQLDPNTSYEYAISFTKVAGLSDPDTWSQRVNMKVHVVAGSNNDLGTMSANVTESNWAEMTKEDLTNIGQPETLTLRKQFTDQQAPVFNGDYPLFDAGDSAVEMSLMLDRPGTVYYVIAPLGYVGTSDGENSYGDNATGIKNWEKLPESGKYDAIDDEDNPNPPILVAPDYLNIVNASSNYRNEKIKYGTVTCGSSVETKLVEGLDKQTRYIAYFVLQGNAQTYSRVLAYRFETTDVSKPVITLTQYSPSVNFETDSSAELTYALIATNELPSSLRSNNGFDKLVDSSKSELWAQLTGANGVYEDENRTVIWALSTPYGSGGYTVFDEFAGSAVRKTVSELVSGSNPMGAAIAAQGKKSLTQANQYFQTQDFTNNMTGGTIYYCLATAVSPLGSETSFAAVGGVQIPDKTPPVLENVSTTITGGSGGAYPTYSGTVTFTFDEPVYQLVELAGGVEQTPMQVWQTNSTLTPEDAEKAVRLIDILGGSIPKWNLNYTNEVKKASTTLTLTFQNVSLGDTITFFSDSFICDASSNSTRQNLTFRLEETAIGNITAGSRVQFVQVSN